MAESKITCTWKPHANSPVSGITDYGNHLQGWIRSREIAVALHRNGHGFFTEEDGTRGYARREGVPPNEFLQTAADWTSRNNLGNLPPCPPGLRRD
jgi:hypothetical protein